MRNTIRTDARLILGIAGLHTIAKGRLKYPNRGRKTYCKGRHKMKFPLVEQRL